MNTIRVQAIGFKNGGRPTYVELSGNATIATLAEQLGVPTGQATFTLNGNSANASMSLSNGDIVSYTMTNIKGA